MLQAAAGLLHGSAFYRQDAAEAGSTVVADLSASPEANVAIKQDGIYQVDVSCSPGKSQGLLALELGERRFAGQLMEREGAVPDQQTAFMIVRLPAGELKLKALYGDNTRLRRIVFSRLNDDSELAQRFKTFEQRSPSLSVYLGLRRDCGSTLTQVGEPRAVSNGELQEFVFEGPINDFPTPDVEKDNVNYLAGVREIGVRSEYTDGRDMPRLLVRSVEFEGPFYESWPPETHRRIFGRGALLPVTSEKPTTNDDKKNMTGKSAHPPDIIRSFATRAFRRPGI